MTTTTLDWNHTLLDQLDFHWTHAAAPAARGPDRRRVLLGAGPGGVERPPDRPTASRIDWAWPGARARPGHHHRVAARAHPRRLPRHAQRLALRPRGDRLPVLGLRRDRRRGPAPARRRVRRVVRRRAQPRRATGSPAPAAPPRDPSPTARWPTSCSTSTARSSTTARRSLCSATSTPTPPTGRTADMPAQAPPVSRRTLRARRLPHPAAGRVPGCDLRPHGRAGWRRGRRAEHPHRRLPAQARHPGPGAPGSRWRSRRRGRRSTTGRSSSSTPSTRTPGPGAATTPSTPRWRRTTS